MFTLTYFWLLILTTTLSPEVFSEPRLPPPFPEDLTNLVNTNMTKVFRVINVFGNGLVSLRNHSNLKSYLNMDSALQKFYKANEDFIKNSHSVTQKNIVKMGYYVAKLGRRYERCQFLQFIKPKEPTSFNLRIRLLDYGSPLVVPVFCLRPMHNGFKALAAQSYTAEIYDSETNLTNATDDRVDYDALRNMYQGKVYITKIFQVEASYPECPHLLCNFVEEVK